MAGRGLGGSLGEDARRNRGCEKDPIKDRCGRAHYADTVSSNELERLARIRMQVTKETLEAAMAALQGHPVDPEPDSDDERPRTPEPEADERPDDEIPPPPRLRLLP